MLRQRLQLWSLRDCEHEAIDDEDDNDDFSGTYYSCNGVQGAGKFATSIACARGGRARAELEFGRIPEGAAEVSLSADGEVFWNETVTLEEAAWQIFEPNKTVGFRAQSSADFSGDLGRACHG